VKKYLIGTALILFFVSSITAQTALLGNWTGGFWLEGNWVIVDVNLKREKDDLNGTADVAFPSYANSISARNVGLNTVRFDSSKIEFEIPFNTEKIVFRGQIRGETISGKFEYGTTKGDFGLIRVVYPDSERLTKFYGIYQVAPDRFVSVFRPLGDPRTLSFIDYKTGQIGTLWSSVRESEFFSGAGRNISFPVTLRVSFEQDTNGSIKSLVWQTSDETAFMAQKIRLKEERIIFKNGNITLGGTLISPAKTGKHPVVIVTPGDYGNNRESLRFFAHHYVSQGIAAFVFDSRGAGESTGTSGLNSFSDLANDVIAGVEALKVRQEVNPRKIGLFGFSNSAWTVSLAASRSNDVSFLILQSFIGVEPWKQDVFRAVNQLRIDNFPESTIKQGANFVRLKFETARTGEGWEHLQTIMEKSRSESWFAYMNMSRSLERLRLVYATFMTYDPVPALEKLNIPVLAYWGENDSYVPVAESVAIFKQAMAKAGNKNYTIKIYPKGRHDLVEGESGSPRISARLNNFPRGFWKMKTDWVKKLIKDSKL
jgi:dienelactone hydrolase